MIKCEGGKVELEEDANKLLSELTAICRGAKSFPCERRIFQGKSR